MSRSNPNTDIPKVCKRYFDWDGSEGGFRWYNKESKERIKVPMPWTFLPLDKLHTVTGFNDKQQSSYWSNEVRDIRKDILVIRDKTGIVYEGTYEGVKKLTGPKYAQSVYIAFKDGGDMVIGNIKMTGAALSAWIDLCKENDITKGAVTCVAALDAKKGATKYKVPVFKMVEVSKESDEQARLLDEQLQEYLKAYFVKAKEEPSKTEHEAAAEHEPEEVDDSGVQDDVTSDLPF